MSATNCVSTPAVTSYSQKTSIPVNSPPGPGQVYHLQSFLILFPSHLSTQDLVFRPQVTGLSSTHHTYLYSTRATWHIIKMVQLSSQRLPRLSHLLLAAGCASASTLVLSNFEDISSKVTVSSSCRSAYNTPLTNCGFDDFGDNACSSKCKSSLLEAQSNIQSDCADVIVDSSSLLSRALKGELVQVTCKHVDNDDTQESATTTLQTRTNSNKNQMMETSTITRKSSSTAEIGTATATAAEAKQTTSLVLAGDEPSASVASGGTGTASAGATETSKSSSLGGDPFASSNDTGSGSGRVASLGYASLVVSAVACVMAII